MPTLYVVSDTDFNAPVKLAVDGEASGSGSTDSTESNASLAELTLIQMLVLTLLIIMPKVILITMIYLFKTLLM